MKKVIVFFGLALGFALFPGAKSVQAATCTGAFSVTGSGSNYTATSSGCDAASYQLNVTGPAGFSPQAISTTLISSGPYSQSISGLTVAGSYQAVLSDQFGTTIGTASFTVTAAVPITACGAKITDADFCAKAQECSGVPANYSTCPTGTGPGAVNLASYGCGGNKWVCIDTTAIPPNCGTLGAACCPGAIPCGLASGYECDSISHTCKLGALTLPAGCLMINLNGGAISTQCAGKNTCSGNGLYCCDDAAKCTQIAAPPAPAPSLYTTTTCADGKSIKTALGCLAVDGKGTISTLLNWGVVVGGGIAFVMILVAAIQINTAQGDAKRVAAARELITAALSGIFLIAVAVVLLNLIGVNILGLNRFGFGG